MLNVCVGFIIVVNLNNFQWLAIDQQGNIIREGMAAGGRSICPENRKSCKTPSGTFQVVAVYKRKFKRSDLYPVDCKRKKRCGAKMYHFTKFTHSGLGMHGSDTLLQYKHLSHGCIRVSKEDALWINSNSSIGTTIIVIPY